MKKRKKASFTVEAAILYPFLLMITFVLVRTTVFQYAAVREQAAVFYDADGVLLGGGVISLL